MGLFIIHVQTVPGELINLFIFTFSLQHIKNRFALSTKIFISALITKINIMYKTSHRFYFLFTYFFPCYQIQKLKMSRHLLRHFTTRETSPNLLKHFFSLVHHSPTFPVLFLGVIFSILCLIGNSLELKR